MKKILVFNLFLLFVFALVGCGVVSLTPFLEPQGISVTSAENVRTIKVNETVQLSAVVYPATVSQEVTWTSSNDTIATVDANGLVTGVAQGNVNIIATSNVKETVTASFALIIERAETQEVAPERIVISAENDITTCKVGQKINLTASVLPVEANQSIAWSSSDSSKATVTRGVVSALAVGEVVITATSRDYSEVSASITLTFTEADDPSLTWAEMAYTTHAEYVTCEDETPIKIKGVVTHVTPASGNMVNYYIQSGKDGFYIYNQDITLQPVEEVKS